MPEPARSNVAKLAAALLLAGVAGGIWWLRQSAAPPVSQVVVAAPSTPPLPSVARSATTPPPQEEEQKLFDAAQAALMAGDTDTAFSLLYEQATKYPKGVLGPARELVHAKTLCRAGKYADARAEAAALVAAHPDSPLSQEARLICAP